MKTIKLISLVMPLMLASGLWASEPPVESAGNITSFTCVGSSSQVGLRSLDVRQCASLHRLVCDSNGLTALDLSQNKALSYLSCRYNSLSLSALSDLLSGLPSDEVERFCGAQRIAKTVSVDEVLDWVSEMRFGTENTVVDFGSVPSEVYDFADGRLALRHPGNYRIGLTNAGLLERYREAEAWKTSALTVYYDLTVQGESANEDLAAQGLATVYVQARTIHVETSAESLSSLPVEVYTLDGRRVYRGYKRSVTVPRAGVYVVRLGTYSWKALVQ